MRYRRILSTLKMFSKMTFNPETELLTKDAWPQNDAENSMEAEEGPLL